MKLIFALLFTLLILILTYYIYKNSSIYYAKTNKESLICKIRCPSRTSIFFLVFFSNNNLTYNKWNNEFQHI